MFPSATKLVWPLLALHYSDAYWLPIFIRDLSDVNSLILKVEVPRTCACKEPMAAKEAEDIKKRIYDEQLQDLKYESFSFGVIKRFLEAKRVKAISIAWDDSFGDRITMAITQKSSIEGFVPLTSSRILEENGAVWYFVKHGNPLAVVANIAQVRFDFEVATSKLPPWAYDKLIQEFDGKLVRNGLNECKKINELKLSTFTFTLQHESPTVAFTLSTPNYFVELPDYKCVFAVTKSNFHNEWVIGATLFKTHRIVFEEKGTYSLPLTPLQVLDLKINSWK